MNKFYAYLQLIRPANIVTSMADILAGYAIVNAITPIEIPHQLLYLLISTIGLYAGGIIFNDVFDIRIDRKERPQRPLPSGQITIFSAVILGIGFFLIALLAASRVNYISFIFVIAIMIFCLTYNMGCKSYRFLGPINMGLCRALNLCLGMSISIQALPHTWIISLIPLIFVTAITLLSQEEVHINNFYFIKAAMTLYLLTLIGLIVLIYCGYLNPYSSLPVIFILLLMNGDPLYKMHCALTPAHLQEAIKVGIMSLIVLDALYSIGNGNWEMGFFILLLLPLATTLAKFFYVT